MRLGSSAHSSVPLKSSFFRRSYSTSSFLKSSSYNSTAFRLVTKLKHLTPNQDFILSDYEALSTKKRLGFRTQMKAQHYKAESRSEVNSSSIDPRFLRLKSPRAGQYIQRLQSFGLFNCRKQFQFHSRSNYLRLEKSKRSAFFRTTRRIVLSAINTPAESDCLSTNRLLFKSRRKPSLLFSSFKSTYKPSFLFRRIYADHSRTIKRNLNAVLIASTLQKNKKCKSNFSSKTSSLAFRFRRALRATATQRKTPFTLPYKVAILKPSLRNALIACNFIRPIVYKVYKARLRRSST